MYGNLYYTYDKFQNYEVMHIFHIDWIGGGGIWALVIGQPPGQFWNSTEWRTCHLSTMYNIYWIIIILVMLIAWALGKVSSTGLSDWDDNWRH